MDLYCGVITLARRVSKGGIRKKRKEQTNKNIHRIILSLFSAGTETQVKFGTSWLFLSNS